LKDNHDFKNHIFKDLLNSETVFNHHTEQDSNNLTIRTYSKVFREYGSFDFDMSLDNSKKQGWIELKN
jgi:spore germination protein YaaH